MRIREIIHETIIEKDDTRKQLTEKRLKQLKLKRKLEEIKQRNKERLEVSRLNIEVGTDFKSMNITNQKQRDAYVTAEQSQIREKIREEERDKEDEIEAIEDEIQKLQCEYILLKDRYDFLMKVFDIEGDIDLEEESEDEEERIL